MKAGETAQSLRASTVLAEVLSSVPTLAAGGLQPPVTLAPEGSTSGLLGGGHTETI